MTGLTFNYVGTKRVRVWYGEKSPQTQEGDRFTTADAGRIVVTPEGYLVLWVREKDDKEFHVTLALAPGCWSHFERII